MGKKYSIEENTLKAIADSIRGKTGETGVITPTNMPSAIENISGGGGESLPSIEGVEF